MGLADFKPARREVKVGETSFHVEALSLTSIATLVNIHLPDLEAVYKLFKERGADLKDAEFESIVTSLIMEAPGLAANIIALASGETDATENAAKLPFGTQLEALVNIADLSFIEVGSVKKAWGIIATLLTKNQTKAPVLTMAPIQKKAT